MLCKLIDVDVPIMNNLSAMIQTQTNNPTFYLDQWSNFEVSSVSLIHLLTLLKYMSWFL